jgi:D-sedoheptulose 7-phosphate isomerase
MKDRITAAFLSHREVMEALERELTPKMIQVAELLVDAFRNGKKLLVMGNGGSAADAQHLAGEIVGRFRLERPGLPAIALNTDTSILTAVGNDYGYEAIFRRRVKPMARRTW